MLDAIDRAANRPPTLHQRRPPSSSFTAPLPPPLLALSHWEGAPPEIAAPSDPEKWPDDTATEELARQEREMDRTRERERREKTQREIEEQRLAEKDRKDPEIPLGDVDEAARLADRLARRDADLGPKLREMEAQFEAEAKGMVAETKPERDAKAKVPAKEMPPAPRSAEDPTQYFASSIAAGSVPLPDGYGRDLVSNAPPPFYADRSFFVPTAERTETLKKLLDLSGVYAGILMRTKAPQTEVDVAIEHLNRDSAPTGVIFPPTVVTPNGSYSPPPGDLAAVRCSTETFHQLLLALAEYRFQNNPVKKGEAVPPSSTFSFSGFTGPIGAEYAVFERTNSIKQRQIAYFDPRYFAPTPVVPERDGRIERLRFSFSTFVQIWTEVDPTTHTWRSEIGPRGTTSIFLRPQVTSNNQWRLGVQLPNTDAPTFIDLSTQYRAEHYRYGSWGRLSSLYSPDEPDAPAKASARADLENRVRAGIDEYRKENKDNEESAEMSESAAEFERLPHAIFAPGGGRELRPFTLRLREESFPLEKIRNAAKGSFWHLNGKVLATAAGESLERGSVGSNPGPLVFSPNGEALLAGSADGTISIWRMPGEGAFERIVLPAHGQRVQQLEFNAMGSYLLTRGADEAVRVWDAESYALLQTYADHQIRSARFSKDGSHVSVQKTEGPGYSFSVRTGIAGDIPEPLNAEKLTAPGVINSTWLVPEYKIEGTVAAGAKAMVIVSENNGRLHTYQWIAGTQPLSHFKVLPFENGSFWAVSIEVKGLVRLWRLEKNDRGIERVHRVYSNELNEAVAHVATTTGGEYLATVTHAGTVRIHRLQREEQGVPWDAE